MTLQEIKEEVARHWFLYNKPDVSEVNWKWDFILDKDLLETCWPEVCRRAQLECARETLKEAAQNAGLSSEYLQGSHELIYFVDCKTINSDSNIKLVE